MYPYQNKHLMKSVLKLLCAMSGLHFLGTAEMATSSQQPDESTVDWGMIGSEKPAGDFKFFVSQANTCDCFLLTLLGSKMWGGVYL